MDYSRPDLAPETQVAADGKTVLRRYRIEAVVYAADRKAADSFAQALNLYCDAARVVEGVS
jgi:hypothetical protein